MEEKQQPYELSVIPTIEANYEAFTGVEKIIAEYFVHPHKNMKYSAKEIATKLHVSEAALSRFAKKIGYSGYREFMYHYKVGRNPKVEQVEEGVLDILNTYQELLNKTYTLISEEQILRVATYIKEKKRIFIYGFGSSGLAASEFALRLLRMGLNAEAITELHQLILNEMRLHDDCLVIGISLSGATKEVMEGLKVAKERQATTILITSNSRKREEIQVDELMLTGVKKNLELGGVISPQFPILILLDLIYGRYLKIEQQEQLIHDESMWKKIKGY